MTLLRRLVIAFALWSVIAADGLLARAADWPQPGYDLSQTGYNAEERVVDAGNIGRLHQVWHGAGGRSVVVAGSRIFTVGLRWTAFGPLDQPSQAPQLFAYDRATHRLLWRATGWVDGLAVSGDVVYVEGERGLEAYAVDCGTDGRVCAPLWLAPIRGTSPTVAADQVYVRTATELLAYPTGCNTPCSPTWRAEIGGGFGPPAARGGLVYVTSDELPGLYAFRAHCATGGGRCDPLWKGAVDGRPASGTSPARART